MSRSSWVAESSGAATDNDRVHRCACTGLPRRHSGRAFERDRSAGWADRPPGLRTEWTADVSDRPRRHCGSRDPGIAQHRHDVRDRSGASRAWCFSPDRASPTTFSAVDLAPVPPMANETLAIRVVFGPRADRFTNPKHSSRADGRSRPTRTESAHASIASAPTNYFEEQTTPNCPPKAWHSDRSRSHPAANLSCSSPITPHHRRLSGGGSGRGRRYRPTRPSPPGSTHPVRQGLSTPSDSVSDPAVTLMSCELSWSPVVRRPREL